MGKEISDSEPVSMFDQNCLDIFVLCVCCLAEEGLSTYYLHYLTRESALCSLLFSKCLDFFSLVSGLKASYDSLLCFDSFSQEKYAVFWIQRDKV